MPHNQRVVDLCAGVKAGLSALDNLQSRTTEPSFHAAIRDNRQRFMEIETVIGQAGWTTIAGLMLGTENKRLDNLMRVFRTYGPDVMFI